MANQPETYQLSKQLNNTSITWIIKRCPVVALFQHNNTSENMGQPFLRNGESDTLLLHIGINETTKQMLITLTQRVATYNKGRLLYLIIPSENLDFRSDVPAYWTLSDDHVPSTSIEQPSDEKSVHQAKLLRMSFCTGTFSRSRVIMPASRVTTQIPPARICLLRKFKALSEVSQFELFTNYDGSVAEGLRRVRVALDKGGVMTPEIKLQGLFPGARDAVLDCWQNEGLIDIKAQKHGAEVEQQKSKKRPRVSDAEMARELSPPPYEPSTPLSKQPAVITAPAHNPTTKAPIHSTNTPNPLAQPQYTPPLHLQLPTWLTHAWTLNPQAHYTMILPLLTLCTSTRTPHLYTPTRIATTTTLYTNWAQHLSSKPHLPTCTNKKHIVTHEFTALLSWLAILDNAATIQTPLEAQADVELSSNLKAVALARHVFLNCNEVEEEKCGGEYVKAKAWFVVKACLRLGSSVLGSGRAAEVEERMVGELDGLLRLGCVECRALS